jgi:septal ring factor EnvC (AmiA/AmiB activator)
MESKTGPPGILFLKEQQKRIDEQQEMISNQAHLVVQRIQEEQHLKSSLKEKDKEIDSLHDIVINLEVRLGLISLVLMSSLSLFLQISTMMSSVLTGE